MSTAIRGMGRGLGELLAWRDLLYMMTWREIRIKYKQSIMGMLWAVLMPTVIVLAGVVVRFGFSLLSGQPLQTGDVASVTVRAVPWAFFVSSLRFATNSLIANSTLVTKIYLPRETFPLAAVLSQLMDFVIASGVLVIVLAVLRVGVSVQLLWVPVLVLILVVFTVGLSLLLSAGSLFFRDVKYLVEVILTFAIFFAPVFYDAEMFGRWATVLMLNPVAPLLEGFHNVIVLHVPPSLPWLGYSATMSLLILAAGLAVFQRLEPYFAESA
jgi:lipopolysaccharide transport system permease protein